VYDLLARSQFSFEWGAFSFSSIFISDVDTLSQKGHKLISVTYFLCVKKIGNLKTEGSPFSEEKLTFF